MSDTSIHTLNKNDEKDEGLLESAGRRVKEKVGEIRHAAEGKMHELGEKSTQEIGENISGYVKHHPWLSLLIAASAGVLLGRIWR